MLRLGTKQKMITAFVFLVAVATARPAAAQTHVGSVSVPSSIADPSNGFTINYTLFGSQVGVGSATYNLAFYISASPDGHTGVATLFSTIMTIPNCNGSGPCFPPSGTQSLVISPFNIPSNTRPLLQSIAAACQPQTWYILGTTGLGFPAVVSASSVMGTVKLPDLRFTGGTLSPSVIQPGGTASISFDLFTQCPTTTGSRVGVFLTDASFNPLAVIGTIVIAPGAGTFSLPPTAITFSPTIPIGNYNILVFADVDGIIAESNENNNAGAFALSVVSGLSSRSNVPGELKPAAKLPVDTTAALHELELVSAARYVSKLSSSTLQPTAR
jgi:hypothetical protein